MEIGDLSDEDLVDEIESYNDRIETLSEYISDESDGMAREGMRDLLYRYKRTLDALLTEQSYRSSVIINNTSIDLSNFIMYSSDHVRFQDGKHVSGPHGGAPRAIKIESNIFGGRGYTVTVYNMDGFENLGQNNIQMAPKQMKIIKSESAELVLRGFGYDVMGNSFEDYGISIHFMNNEVQKCTLHMYDRNVDIDYLP